MQTGRYPWSARCLYTPQQTNSRIFACIHIHADAWLERNEQLYVQRDRHRQLSTLCLSLSLSLSVCLSLSLSLSINEFEFYRVILVLYLLLQKERTNTKAFQYKLCLPVFKCTVRVSVHRININTYAAVFIIEVYPVVVAAAAALQLQTVRAPQQI